MSDLRLTLETIANGEIPARSARWLLRGIDPPNQYVQWIKKGRWSIDGGLPRGARGLHMAAEKALDAMYEERP